MAKNTDPRLQQQIIYSVFVRNHTEEGTFRAVIPDLPRIRALGADFIWLMPVHPIGEKERKGTLGSPYAISDYRAVNPEYGTLDDFRALVDAIHANGMRCMIDVVYNHTSPDSVLSQTHPEFFYHRPDGSFGNQIGDWSDVIDLDYFSRDLWNYQIETLKYWAGIVDGFRCDVASFVPLPFWKAAREAVAEVRPDCVWLAESVHLSFGVLSRRFGKNCPPDRELYEAFDMEYEYDIREVFDRYIRGEASLSHWLDMLNFQDFVYPAGYNKLRYLENHDQPRIASFVHDEKDLENFTAQLFFLKGTTLLYAGQEYAAVHQPSLFDKDTIVREEGRDISPLFRKLADFKKEHLDPADDFFALADDQNEIAVMTRDNKKRRMIGIFSLKHKNGRVPVDAPDGAYINLLSGETVFVKDGHLLSDGKPCVIRMECA